MLYTNPNISNLSYTATEDCVITGIVGREKGVYFNVTLDGKTIYPHNANHSGGWVAVPIMMYIPKGATIVMRITDGSDNISSNGSFSINIWGLK